MPRFLLAALLLTLVAVPAARADGCKFRSDGRKVPEREQRAFVEWADGTETLHVAALSDPTTSGSVWVVPVRAAAADVRAEPVDDFPVVTYYETLRHRAERSLRGAIGVTAFLNSGGFCCLMADLACGGPGEPKAAEASRVERLGMVVTVVSAESRSALEEYLAAQGVDRAAADLSSLDPYFGKPDFAFVCGWVAGRGEPVTATGLKVVFPSPTLWFPLLPTRAYAEPVETVVYARGFVKPAPGCDLPGLKCEYVYGEVKTWGVARAFGRDLLADAPGYWPRGPLAELTRVTLTTDPQKWDRDLELVPGTTAVGTAALVATRLNGPTGTLLSALLGAVLGLAIAPLTVPRAERWRADWLAGVLTGAAIVCSLWASAVVFGAWRWFRFRDGPRQPRPYVVLPLLGLAHFAVVFAVCRLLLAWVTASA